MRTSPCWYTRDLVFYELQVITNLVFTSKIWYCSLSVPAHQLRTSTLSPEPLHRLLPTTSTTCTTTSYYFNNSYDYFRLFQQLVQLLLVWPRQGATSPILGQVGLVSLWVLSPGWRHPHLVALNPRTSFLRYKLSSSHNIRVWVLFSSNFLSRNRSLSLWLWRQALLLWIRAPFLFYTTVAISPLMIRAWTPSCSLLHIHLQFQIVSLPFLAGVLWFACRESLLGKVNQVVLGW
jgi:hypothetical protein